MLRKISIMITILVTLSLVYTGFMPVEAQETPQIKPPLQNSEIKVDDKMLNKFISAAKEIEAIKTEYTKKFQGMEDQAKAMELQQKAQEEVNKVLEKYQLDHQRYNSIGNAVTQNPKLMEKVQKELSK